VAAEAEAGHERGHDQRHRDDADPGVQRQQALPHDLVTSAAAPLRKNATARKTMRTAHVALKAARPQPGADEPESLESSQKEALMLALALLLLLPPAQEADALRSEVVRLQTELALLRDSQKLRDGILEKMGQELVGVRDDLRELREQPQPTAPFLPRRRAPTDSACLKMPSSRRASRWTRSCGTTR
jgi:hypothetical protein